ncbi:SGNH/GDSL hydrolase family protein [Pelolinea submarina]|uniref:GDSL-like lipase/acylhydrolase family protein n=1 Tax=Pelolinea submarina TaxID=913107 RepID=A0A347ZT60_9CHLR|nr:SGNH/GDSL hydrolase family protein [Pelolinea submarina]REG10934.1 hypothetical protein DFR64_0803 [Pelolinea submarina]BBB48491.1 hypothetical protein Pelsub_P1719 [Pelolinea submarina]
MRSQKALPVRILIKAGLFAALFNMAFSLLMNVPIGSLSLYNHLYPGRERFPFGENPSTSYNLSIYNLDAMIASHEISAAKKEADEFRVFIVGDSSTWGFLQNPGDTLAGLLDSRSLELNDKNVRVYNLGYPSLSVVKDLMIIDRVKQYDPDLIIWLVTLESLPVDNQLETPLVANNPILVNDLIDRYQLTTFEKIPVVWKETTLVARRRELADIIRLQIYGAMWAGTGIDQDYPDEYTPALRDFAVDESFYDFSPYDLDENRLALNVISQTVKLNSDIQFLVVNEPILIAQGENSDIRYDYYYPRWAYDQYRGIIQEKMDKAGINYNDLWDIVPQEYFTNSAIHMDKSGEEILAERIASLIIETDKQ